MATALQQQLAAISASTTNTLDLKAQRTEHGKSLLFEPKIAVSQDFDTLFQICLEGFKELCNIDLAFATFSKSLFSDQSKTEDRLQMTAEENKNLDKVIRSFLGLVSGRLLLKPALKAVEWLVRRFRIQEYNLEYTLTTFLPYHEAPIFETLLSILPRHLPHSYRFLQPYLASYKSPPRAAITSAAITNRPLFSVINSHALDVVREHHQSPILLSFWASMATQALDGMITTARSGRGVIQRQQEEDILLLILPVLNEGLTFKHCPEMIVACYMVIMVLVAKTTLEDRVLDGMLEATISSRQEATEESCLVCLAVIAQERKSTRLPRKVLKKCLKITDLDLKLAIVSHQCRVDRLSLGIILGIFEKSGNLDQTRVELVSKLVGHGLFADNQLRIILKAVVRLASKGASQSTAVGNSLATMVNNISHSAGAKLVELILDEENTDIDTLELTLGQVLSVSLRPQDVVMQDVEVKEEDGTETHENQLEAYLSKLRHATGKGLPLTIPDIVETSFFKEVTQAYVLSVATRKDSDAIMALPCLASGEKLDNKLANVLRIHMTATQYPAAVRSTAWRSVAKSLDASNGQIDAQLLIPYLINALADASPTVRRSASEAALALSKTLKAAMKGKGVAIWGSDLYAGGKGEVEWLATEDAAKITYTVLVPFLEECILDQDRVTRLIESALIGKDGKTRNDQQASIDIKSTLRTSFANFLASHATKSPLAVRSNLFGMFVSIGKPAAHARSKYLIPSARDWFSLKDKKARQMASQEHVALEKIDEQQLAVIHPRDSDSMQFLRSLLSGDSLKTREQTMERVFDRLKAIWSQLKTSARDAMATFLLDLSLPPSNESDRVNVSAAALEVLRAVSLPAQTLVNLLESVPPCTGNDYKSIVQTTEGFNSPKDTTRKRRQSNVGSPEALKRQKLSDSKPLAADPLGMNLRRITIVLEIVDNSKQEGHIELLKGLFYVLSELQHYRSLSNSNMVYLQNLTIGSLLSIVNAAKGTSPSGLDTAVIRADLLVDCVRRTNGPQVQNAALLLISSLASWLPETVLHSVMPIFTFMGSTLLRQGDDYTAHVIDQTIRCVVPPLAVSLRKKNRNFVLGISELLLSFTAAFEHIPSHRRLNLFTQLVKTLGPSDALAPTLMLLFDRHPLDTAVQRFVPELLRQFDPVVALKALKQSLDLLEDAMKPKTKRQLGDALFSLNEKSLDEAATTYENLLLNIERATDNSTLRGPLAKAFREGGEHEQAVRTSTITLVEKAIHISTILASQKQMHVISRRVIIATLNLPPPIELVRIAQELLARADDEIKRTTLKAIQIRAKAVKHDDIQAIREYLAFLPQVLHILDTSDDPTLRELAIACVDRISTSFGKKDSDAVLSAGQTILGSQILKSEDSRLKTIALHCLSSIVEVLGNSFIPLVPAALSTTFDQLRESLNSDSLLHNAAYSLICAVIEHLPFIFVGNYLKEALELSHKSAASHEGEENEQSRRQFYLLLSTTIEPKERFQALNATWASAVGSGYSGLLEHVEALDMSLKNSPKSIITNNCESLFQVLLQGFDLRNTNAMAREEHKLVEEEVSNIEHLLTDATLSMVYKLNDATFRPFFSRFSSWAQTDLPKKELKGRMRRSISFYGFLRVFFDRLNRLVTNYASYILDFSAEVLKAPVTGHEGEKLIENVLGALQKSFEHDEDDFWQSPSHFTAVAAPLTGLLTNDFSNETSDLIIPAITALANAASSADLSKQLNTSIMQMFRSENAVTRLAAVKCEQSLTEALGEEWLALLAEMVPFIAELQEDDDEDVEKETQRWIKMIEETLGESLDNMLQ